VKFVSLKPLVAIMYGRDDQLRNFLFAEISQSGPALIQQVVHGEEGFPGIHALRRKSASSRQATSEAERHEERLADHLPMR
jgi:hypothetical protein